ncbi:hypothetical protein KXW76_007877, partial [Aspergillus fumigatus]
MWKILLNILALAGVCHSIVSDIPSVYGPIPHVGDFSGVDSTKYLKRRPGDFVHPGIWHTHEDLERIRTNVISKKDPWASAYEKFSADEYSQANYQMQGPHAVISRGKISNYTSFAHDVRAAWQNALMWYITRNQSHWDR